MEEMLIADASQVLGDRQTYPESELFCEIEACIRPVKRLAEVPTHRVYHEISVVQTAHYYGE